MSLPGDQAAYVKGTYVAQDFLDNCTGVVFLPLLWICWLARLMYLQLQLEVSTLQSVLMTFQTYSWHCCVLVSDAFVNG